MPFLSVYLTYDNPRERENYHVGDFEVPQQGEEVVHFNTDLLSTEECSEIIYDKVVKLR